MAKTQAVGTVEPDCRFGFSDDLLRSHLTAEQYASLGHFMRGQTGTICDGSLYDHTERRYYPSHCGPHGFVIYPWDYKRWVRWFVD